MQWIVVLSILIVFGLVLSQYGVPLLVRRLNSNVRITSIGLRSARGVFIKFGIFTYTADRIALGLHRPPGELGLRVVLEVVNVVITVAKIEKTDRRPKGESPWKALRERHSRALSIASIGVIIQAAKTSHQLPIARRIVRSIADTWRALFRTASVLGLKLFVRLLPALTQSFDIRCDKVTLISDELGGAYATVRGIRLSTVAEFTQQDQDSEDAPETAKHEARDIEMKYKLAWGKWRGSVERVWDRATAKTDGFASVELEVEEISAYLGPLPGVQTSPDFMSRRLDSNFASEATKVEGSMPPNAILFIQGLLHMKASASFNPQKSVFKRHSGEFHLRLPTVELALDTLLSLVKRIPRRKDPSNDVYPQQSNTPSDSGVSSPWSPVKRTFSPPTSPKLPPISMQTKWNPANRLKRKPKHTLPQVFFAVLKGLELSVSDIIIRHQGIKAQCGTSGAYSATVKGFLTRLQLSQPSNSVLHQKWLGSKTPTPQKLGQEVFSFTFRTRLFTVHREGGSLAGGVRLVRVGELVVESVFTQWPVPWLVHPKFLSGDPNAAVVAVEVDAEGAEVCERVEIVRLLLENFPRFPATTRTSRGPIIHPVPSFSFIGKVRLLSLRLLQPSPTGLDIACLHLQTQGFGAHASSRFQEALSRTTPSYFENLDHIPLSMPFHFGFHLEPLALTAESEVLMPTEELADDASWSMSPFAPSTPNPSFISLPSMSKSVFTLSGVDLDGKGTMLGHHTDDRRDGVSIDLDSTLAELRWVTDDILVDLSHPDPVAILSAVIQHVHIDSAAEPPEQKAIITRLPFGWTMYLSISSLRLAMAGLGINPEETRNVVQGFALKTSIRIRFCYLCALRHIPRMKDRFVEASSRDRLGLGDSIIRGASEHAPNSVTDGRAALVQFTFSNTKARCIVNPEDSNWLEALGEEQAFTAGEDVDAEWLLRLPKVEGDALLRRRGINSPEDSCRVAIQLDVLRGRLDMHHVYCILTAFSTLAALSPKAPYRQPPRDPLRRPPSLSFTACLKSDDIQLITIFPSKSRLFVRLQHLTYDLSAQRSHSFRSRSLCAWVPPPAGSGPWDELAQFTNCVVTLDSINGEHSITTRAKGFRLRIPHQFIISDLIQDVSVCVKASKHLVAVVAARRYFPMPKPPIEAAKKVPVLKISIDCINIDVVDHYMETSLNLIWRTGFEEQRRRRERETAFEAKVDAIRAAAAGEACVEVTTSTGKQRSVSAAHTVSIEDARQRLDLYNSNAWVRGYKAAREEQIAAERAVAARIKDPASFNQHQPIPIQVRDTEGCAALVRIVLTQVSVDISPPKPSDPPIPDYLFDLGKGLPRDTEFTLLIPLRLQWTMDSAKATLRDYPLPLLSVGPNSKAWDCATTLVIAEEAGGDSSTDWVECLVRGPPATCGEDKPLRILVPKTVMPVKTYADPTIRIRSHDITDICWGVSYTPALQDVMRVLDTLSTAPRDKSPAIGFWDKIRLVMHWRLMVEFEGEVQLHVKGSRDPYYIEGVGAGFVLCFSGPTKVMVGYSSEDKELIQLSSQRTVLAIPDLQHFKKKPEAIPTGSRISPGRADFAIPIKRKLRKVCAKLTNGVRWGLGFALERTCGLECSGCQDKSLIARKCRYFDFLPHYKVALRATPSSDRSPKDSYAGFRSHFIHFSLSLTSPTSPDNSWIDVNGNPMGYNIFHLTPKAFAHFFSWWSLFDGTIALPIQQGALFPRTRPPSPKFGRHLATLKYRFCLSPLFISHVYKQDYREQWREGETGCIGVKVMVESLRADLHQRAQEFTLVDPISGIVKKSTHKPFSAAEVVLTGLEMRAMSAMFADPRKALVPLFQDQQSAETVGQPTCFPDHQCQDLASKWFDIDDFVEIDWTPTDQSPRLWMFQAATCPRFTFFRSLGGPLSHENDAVGGDLVSKFGDEDTHVCLLAQGESTQSSQIHMATRRIAELQSEMDALELGLMDELSARSHDSSNSTNTKYSNASQSRMGSLQRSIIRLRDFVDQLEAQLARDPSERTKFSLDGLAYCPPDDWANFQHVYEVHSPQVVLSNSTRNILLNYYYASVSRRGFEYHMSARALKFIREQAQAELRRSFDSARAKPEKVGNPAAKAATALRRLLSPDANADSEGDSKSVRFSADGSEGQIAKRSSHFCILLRPQVLLHCEEKDDSVVYLAAMEASLQTFTILDMQHADDPVNGYIMARNHVKLRGLQAFVPATEFARTKLKSVPLEVLVDFRCESDDFQRLVPQTDATIRYDKFNRLRLHNKLSNVSGELADLDSTDDHLLYQTDRIMVDIPRFTVTANSESFSALQNIVSHLLLYTDPTHSHRNEALETFLFTYDFTDFSSAAEVVATLQAKIRQLSQIARRNDLKSEPLDETSQLDALSIHAHLTSLADELDFIFAAIRLAQEKAHDFDDTLTSALKLDVSSDLISWQMLGLDDSLIAKLAVKGVTFGWTSRKDSTASNLLRIKDLQALSGDPNTAFPELLVAHTHPHNHPMVKRKLFAEAEWTILPPVGQISVIGKLDLRIHPVKVQIERKVGRDIQEYVSPKRLRVKNSATLPSSNGHSTPPGAISQANNSPPFHFHRVNTSPTTSNRRSFETPSLMPPKLTIQRASSFSNLREAAAISAPQLPPQPKSRSMARVPSSANIREKGNTPRSPRDLAMTRRQGTIETEEMRARAQKRTFLSIDLHSFLLVLTYKGEPLRGALPRAKDLVPSVDNFHLSFPKFEHRNCTWSVEEFLADVKTELMRNALGVVLKAVAAKANKRFHVESLSPYDPPRTLEDDHSQMTNETSPPKAQGRFHLFASKSKHAPSPTPIILPDVGPLDVKVSQGQGDPTPETSVVTGSPASSRSTTASSGLAGLAPFVQGDEERNSLQAQNTRTGKVLKFFRRSHRYQESGDSFGSSNTSTSSVQRPKRQSFDHSPSESPVPSPRRRTFSDRGHS